MESYITKIRFREDTAINWTTNNPILASSEPARETDTGKIKIGDGQKRWNELSYINNPIESFDNYNSFIESLLNNYENDNIKTIKVTGVSDFTGNLYKVSFNINDNTYNINENFNQNLFKKDEVVYTNNYYITKNGEDKKIGLVIIKNGYDLILEIPLAQEVSKNISVKVKPKTTLSISQLDSWEISGRDEPIEILEGNVNGLFKFSIIYN